MNETNTQEVTAKPSMKVKDFIRAFANGTLSKRKRKMGRSWVVTVAENKAQVLTYHAFEGGTEVGKDVIAVRLPDGRFIFNAARHRWAGTMMAWGNRTRGWRRNGAEWFQLEWSEGGKMGVPFNVLTQLGLEPSDIVITEKANDEYLDVENPGARLEQVIKSMEEKQKAGEFTHDDLPALIVLLKQGDKDRNNYISSEREDGLKSWADRYGITVDQLKRGHTFTFGLKGKSTMKVHARENSYNKGEYTLNVDFVFAEPRHFIGACLFKVGKTSFLFDVDRQEVKHRLFNPFVAVVKGEPTNITEAYEMLKPEAVVAAEKKGLEVKRQGEWFFIPARRLPAQKKLPLRKLRATAKKVPSFEKAYSKQVKRSYIGATARYVPEPGRHISESIIDQLVKAGISKRSIEMYNKQVDTAWEAKRLLDEHTRQGREQGGTLRAGNNRPNRTTKMRTIGGETFVSGTVTHDGREHKELTLTGWYKAVPNTAVSSFQVTGDVD